jgi:hypothetical protein
VTIRSLARYLRVVLACLALAVASPAGATAAQSVDVIAWVARASGAEAATVAADEAETPARADVPTAPSTPKDLEPVRRAPASARASVVQSRLYIRNEALLC